MGVHRNIDANFLRGVMPKVPSKKHPYENFGMPYVFFMKVGRRRRVLAGARIQWGIVP